MAALLLAAAPLFSGDVSASTWTFGGNGIWQTPSNWLGGVPTAGDGAIFTLPSSYAVATTADATAASLSVNAGSVGLDFSGRTLAVGGGVTVAANSLLNFAGGTLSATSLNTSAGSLNFADGTIVVSGGTYSPAQRTIVLSTDYGSFTYSNSFVVSGTVSSAARPTLKLIGGAVTALVAPGSNTFAGSILVGINGGRGTAFVDGSGSALKAVAKESLLGIGIGGINVGSTFFASAGALTITHGGQAGAPRGIAIGSNGGIGTASVDGSGSTLGGMSETLSVGTGRYGSGGAAGTGTLLITGGGSAEFNFYYGGVSIGAAGGVGHAVIDGAGSSLLAGALCGIGQGEDANDPDSLGDGDVAVRNGGRMYAGEIYVGSSNGTGRVMVDGSGSTFEARTLFVGGYNPLPVASAAGGGSLSVTRGGKVIAGVTLIGADGGSGRAVIDGAGSTLQGDGILFVGDYPSEGGAASGTLTLSNGATATYPEVSIGSHGGRGYLDIGKPDGTDSGNTRLVVDDLRLLNESVGSPDEGAILNIRPGGRVEVKYSLVARANAANISATQINIAGGELAGGYVTNDGLLNVSVGTFANARVSGTGRMTVTGGCVTDAAIFQSALVIGGTATVKLLSATPSVVGTIAFSGAGKVDLSGSTLIVNYAAASPYSNVRAAAAAGYNAGVWDGSGLTSQSGATRNAVAVVEAADLYSTFPLTFAGVSIDSTTLIAYATLAGDANLDRAVGSADFNAFVAYYGSAAGRWTFGDFNYDDAVDTRDFAVLLANFGKTFSLAGALPAAGTVVPEPAAGAILLAACGLWRRRREHR